MVTVFRPALVVVLTATFGVLFGQTTPVKATVCEIVKDPQRFQGELVSVHDRVRISFENFELSAAECKDQQIDGIWLEYGKGPKRQPTIWCCGDLTPRDPLVLVQNSEFRRFHHFLTAEKRTKGCYRWQCYAYQVTATLTGRIDAVVPTPCPNGSSCCFGGGFGHFGMSCARLVIQSVADVVVQPVDGSANR
jgi:hypothetical protein